MLESTPPLRVRCDGNVSAQAALDGGIENSLEFLNDVAFFPAVNFLPLIGKVHLPVGAFADRRVLATASASDRQDLAGGQNIDAFKAAEGARHGEEIEDRVDAATIGLRLDETGGQDRLDLRSKDEPVGAKACGARPEQRANAEAIARQDKFLLALIEQGDGELAVELGKHVFFVFFPQVRKKLGIARRRESVAVALEIATP